MSKTITIDYDEYLEELESKRLEGHKEGHKKGLEISAQTLVEQFSALTNKEEWEGIEENIDCLFKEMPKVTKEQLLNVTNALLLNNKYYGIES